ncbi:muscle M-line assembly protein unc-89-like [Chironomus tepperi]|uniref:muscle M-line assembly protein unc-89-like n=1 Tax=Chironomus tepperi TaxID=113505 RepID=UPI00391F035B
MVRERRGKKSKSKDVEEAPPAPVLLEVPQEPAINRFFKREKSPFEVGDKKELQVASSHAIIDKACVMDISGGAAQVAAKVDEYINLLFTDYCALDQASCGDISKEIKIVVIEEEGDLASIQPALSVEEEEKQRKEAEEAARKAAEEEVKRRAEEEQRAREEEERLAREEEERIVREEAERIAAEEAEKIRIEEEKKQAIEEEKRKKAEAEAKKKAEEEEKAKKEAEEKARLEAEAEAARKKAEEEAYDSDRELIPPKEEDDINWEAVEEDAPLVPDVLQELIEQRATEEEEEAPQESEKEMTERDRDLEWQRQRQMMRPPLVISHLKSRAVPIGSTAKLTCNVTGPSLSVRWLKNGNPVELKPDKYKFFNSEGLLSLEILNVTKKDAGEYTCFAKNKNGETSTIASVTVYDTDVERPIPPTFITIKGNNQLHFFKKISMSLKKWKKSKVEEPPKEVEEKVELDKWGDPIKKRKRKVRPLSLWAQREKLEFTVHLPATLTVIEDRNARFICGVSGGGDLEITWYKNDKKIRFERFPRILDYTRNSTGCIGIECSQMADAGVYKCTFTDKEKGETLTTQCELIVVPRIKRTKELSKKIPPAFVRKLQYTYKPEDDQLIVHCTILANPEPSIKWYVQKVPLHLCPLPRVTVFNHPDDVHEHTIASLVILGPSYLDNGEYVIEVENDAGFERRVLNIQFQTEEEYNEKYYRRYLEHKEHFKLHEYGPGEERWEDIVPEVKEFHFYEPEPEVAAKKVSASGKIRKRRKKHRLVKKKVMMPWGEEEEQEVSDENASSESYTASESEQASEPEEEEGWGPESEPEEEQSVVGESKEAETESMATEVQSEIAEEQKEPEPEPEIVTETEPETVEETKEPTPEPVEEIKEPEPEPEPEPVVEPVAEPEPEASTEIQAENLPTEKPAFKPPEFEDFEPKNRDYEPDVVRMRQEDPEFPYIWKRPKFYITDFQLRKKFYFVNKLIDVEMVKGKTLRLESFAAALGKVTVEWRFNGRIIGETHRRTIEFNPHRNLTVLEIENTRVQDSGTYSVVFYNDYTEPLIDACKVNIIVPKPLETADQPPTFTRLLTDTYKERTDELILDCHVRGIPKPTVTWYKNGNEVPTDNPRYHFEHDDDGNCTFTIINPIKNADRGRYVVKAKNHVGEDECQLRVWFRGKEDDDIHERAEYRRTQKMYKSRHVKEKDEDEWGGELYHSKRLDKQKEYDHRYKLSWLSRITAQTLAQGSTLKFVAFVDGKYPQFDWYYNDIPLVHGRKYRQIVTKNGKGCLIIHNVQPMDSGIYRLVVKNYANSIDCEAKVTVYAYEHKDFDPPLFLNTLTGKILLFTVVITSSVWR